MIKKFNEYVNEELDASTVGVVGSGTAITGYPTGTYTPAAGVSVYGGDSESSFAGNSSGAKGMEQEVICPPKNIFRDPIVKKRRKNKKERLNNQIGATIDSLSKPILKVNEAVQKYHRTMICQINNIDEAHTIINRIKHLPPVILVSHNETIENLSAFPNWLFIEMEPSNKLYVNYWGEGDGYESNLEDVMDSLTRSTTDHHMYTYDELPALIKNIRAYYDIPEVPNYNPRKINHNENMKTFNEFINESIKDKMTPKPIEQIEKGLSNMSQEQKNYELVLSVIRDETEIVKLLIDNGADVNVRDDKTGWTVLMWATQRGHTDIAKQLIDNGADVNANYNGQTALGLASTKSWGREDIMKLLIDNGAKDNKK